MNLAMFAGYAFRKYTSAKIVFGDQQDAEGAKMLDEASSAMNDTDEFQIDPASPLGLYQHMSNCKNTVPPRW